MQRLRSRSDPLGVARQAASRAHATLATGTGNCKREKARDIAFSLAVMKVNERQNVNYLLRLLQSCSATRGGDPRYECDGKLVYEVSTLYWRGHNDLLLPLFGTGDFLESDSYPFAGSDVSEFYGYLLSWRQDALLTALAALPAQTQQAVCHRAIAALPNTVPQRSMKSWIVCGLQPAHRLRFAGKRLSMREP